jgi:enterochelin esterase family protein
MKSIRAVFIWLGLISMLFACAGTKPPHPATPSASVAVNLEVVSPEVNADRRVTLRLRADKAKSVIASGDIGDLALVKDFRKIWSVTTDPLEPAIYKYFFTVDGTRIADPNNPDRKSAAESLLTVPGDPPMPWEARDIPHGKVVSISYASKAFGAERRYFVYASPGYEESADKLPALYLFHGYTDDDSSWTAIGKANLIADSLLADGKIKPLFIVMPYGQLDADTKPNEAFAEAFQREFESQILSEILPAIEKAYPIVTDARHRAMAGVSMGGMQAAFIGMNHPEVFSTVGLWSSAVYGDPAALLSRLAAAPAELKNSFAYVQVAVGRQDDLNLLPRSEAIDAFLSSQNVPHVFTPTEGTHSWLLWRRYLVDFLIKFSALAR